VHGPPRPLCSLTFHRVTSLLTRQTSDIELWRRNHHLLASFLLLASVLKIQHPKDGFYFFAGVDHRIMGLLEHARRASCLTHDSLAMPDVVICTFDQSFDFAVAKISKC